MSPALRLLPFIGALIAATPGSVFAAGPVCVVNDFEVPWVHPGIAFYAVQDDETCEGPGMMLKKGESGCFADAAVIADGGWELMATDATSGACIVVCPLTRDSTRIVYSQSKVYACKD